MSVLILMFHRCYHTLDVVNHSCEERYLKVECYQSLHYLLPHACSHIYNPLESLSLAQDTLCTIGAVGILPLSIIQVQVPKQEA